MYFIDCDVVMLHRKAQLIILKRARGANFYIPTSRSVYRRGSWQTFMCHSMPPFLPI
jgi:hypothetical protein